jgi:hypothetical protein
VSNVKTTFSTSFSASIVAVSPRRFQSNIFMERLDSELEWTVRSPFLDVKDDTVNPATMFYRKKRWVCVRYMSRLRSGGKGGAKFNGFMMEHEHTPWRIELVARGDILTRPFHLYRFPAL